jgi:hypothetical protein
MKKYMLTISALALLGGISSAQAETIRTQTTISPVPLEDVNTVNFSEMDINRDGILSRTEVGEKLFYIFDTDGNMVVDNIEFRQKRVYTIIPVEQKTVVSTDFNDDGIADETKMTYDSFIRESGLMRFDEDKDGLSPEDFIQQSFLSLDDNEDGTLDVEEWKEAYVASRRPLSAEQERYNTF